MHYQLPGETNKTEEDIVTVYGEVIGGLDYDTAIGGTNYVTSIAGKIIQ